jgi:hypothetical protein
MSEFAAIDFGRALITYHQRGGRRSWGRGHGSHGGSHGKSGDSIGKSGDSILI